MESINYINPKRHMGSPLIPADITVFMRVWRAHFLSKVVASHEIREPKASIGASHAMLACWEGC